MNAGYSSGWCEDSFSQRLVATEILCQARGDPICRFIMAHPNFLLQKVQDYRMRHPEGMLRTSSPFLLFSFSFVLPTIAFCFLFFFFFLLTSFSSTPKLRTFMLILQFLAFSSEKRKNEKVPTKSNKTLTLSKQNIANLSMNGKRF
jgi:hypothetical protein